MELDGLTAPIDEITEKEQQIARIMARRFLNTAETEDDLFQYAMLAILKAKRKFNPSAGVKYETFITTCIKNYLIDILRKNQTSGNIVDIEPEESLTGETLEKTVETINAEKIIARALAEAKPEEKVIFDAYLGGNSYAEIATQNEKTIKQIDNIIQKIKHKIKSAI
ncbi:MAG: sigma-70 family RNA polymerase sigma factor [Christensenellaceae bacterium]|jgi:RNA polymerase sigma factor (sigma-70 family)|nr:sigma-70 family RNA polymerase sigma factor [Christensenellaceae bacterium]